MRDRVAAEIRSRLGLTARFKVRPGQSGAAIELPPIAGYGPLPDSSWLLIILGIAAIVALAVPTFS
jgi:hypothetical protein